MPDDVRETLSHVAHRGDGELFRALARHFGIADPERNRLWQAARAQPRRALVDPTPHQWTATQRAWWSALFQPVARASWRERRRTVGLWLAALVGLAVPLVFLVMALHDFLVFIPLPP